MDLKVLYISSFHAKLESDDLRLFTSLGVDWFSTGYYKNPQEVSFPQECMYSPMEVEPNTARLEEFNKLNPNHAPLQPINLTTKFVDEFDLVILVNCCPLPNELNRLWEFIKHKPVIVRTYGQQGGHFETVLTQAVKAGKVTTVRVGKSESKIPNFAGSDFEVLGYIDSEKFSGWQGFGNEVLTFNNYFNKRAYHSNTPLYRRVVKNFNSSLYGMNNEGVDICKGVATEEQQLELYKNCGVYFSLGSKPALLTYSLQEAMTVGCPVVTFGPKLGNGNPPLYEVPTLFKNGIDLFLGDSEEELVYYINLLLTNEVLAKKVSSAARQVALDLWSFDKVKSQWEEVIKFATR